jgi:hypothetical protein
LNITSEIINVLRQIAQDGESCAKKLINDGILIPQNGQYTYMYDLERDGLVNIDKRVKNCPCQHYYHYSITFRGRMILAINTQLADIRD